MFSLKKSYRIEEGRPGITKPLAIAAIVLAGLLLAAVVAVRVYYEQNLKPVGGEHAVSFTIEPGTSVSEIATGLEDEGIVRSAAVFSWYVRSKEAADNILAGTYNLQSSLGIPEIVSILTNGEIATDLVTILPGQRLDQIRQSLINNGFDQTAVDAALEPTQYDDNPALSDKPTGATLEGFLYPESFQRTKDTDPKEIIFLSLAEMDSQLTPDLRKAFANQGLTVFEAVTLASIVGKEANCDAGPEVCRTIAQVFLRRLAVGMSLGSDVTAFYGAAIADQTESVSYDSPYNTRIYPGLPPGPISNVSQDSLAAVAYPTNTDWLYFVAGDDDVTYFSRTLQEHEALVAEHCIEKCSQ